MKKSENDIHKRLIVAKLAGVSETTVSRVYNHPERVDGEKVRRVLEAAKEAGYVPNKYASALRRKGTGVLLFLEMKSSSAYNWTEIPYFNWFYAEILRTLFSAMERNTYQLRHIKVASPEEIEALRHSRICDGIIAFEMEGARNLQALASVGIPFICCHHTEKFETESICATNNFKGGLIAGQYLANTGHKKPAYVTGYVAEVFSHRERLNGFISAFSGIDVKILSTQVGMEGGYESGLALTEPVRGGEIDSIGVVNDLTAIGVIHAFMKKNIRIPEDVSIIGYDNLPFTISLPFKLATIELSLGGIYTRAVELLIKSIKTGETCREIIDPILVPGDSVSH